MLLAALTLPLLSCGSDEDTSAPAAADATTTSVPGDQHLEDARQDYLDAIASAGWDMFGPGGAECVGNAAIDAVGIEVLVAEDVEPDEFGEMESLRDLDLELDDEGLARMARALEPCFGPEYLETITTSMFRFELTDEMLDCLSEQTAKLMGQVVALSFATGEDTTQQRLAELMTAGTACRWEADPITDGADLTLDGGRAAYVDAVADEILSVPPGTLSMTDTEAACTAAAVLDVIGEDTLLDLGTTARELSQYVDGRAPDSIGLTIDEATAEQLVDASLACRDLRTLTEATFGLMFPPEVVEDMVDCVLEEVPEEVWRDHMALQFQVGVEGMQGPEGQALLAQQMEAGAYCGARVAAD